MLCCRVPLPSPGDGHFPRAAAVRRVFVHRPPAESAEEPDVLHPVLLRYGAHVLHLLHVHGEPNNTQAATHCGGNTLALLWEDSFCDRHF